MMSPPLLSRVARVSTLALFAASAVRGTARVVLRNMHLLGCLTLECDPDSIFYHKNLYCFAQL